ncbi:MAG: hypothetical protein M0Z77_01600 [Thermoplasmatales archaeon]|nr:hypothetical protein [Thermoplasmatales archaeon]
MEHSINISAYRGHFSLPNLLSLAKEGIEAFIPSPERGTPGKRRQFRKELTTRADSHTIPLRTHTGVPRGMTCIIVSILQTAPGRK